MGWSGPQNGAVPTTKSEDLSPLAAFVAAQHADVEERNQDLSGGAGSINDVSMGPCSLAGLGPWTMVGSFLGKASDHDPHLTTSRKGPYASLFEG